MRAVSLIALAVLLAPMKPGAEPVLDRSTELRARTFVAQSMQDECTIVQQRHGLDYVVYGPTPEAIFELHDAFVEAVGATPFFIGTVLSEPQCAVLAAMGPTLRTGANEALDAEIRRDALKVGDTVELRVLASGEATRAFKITPSGEVSLLALEQLAGSLYFATPFTATQKGYTLIVVVELKSADAAIPSGDALMEMLRSGDVVRVAVERFYAE